MKFTAHLILTRLVWVVCRQTDVWGLKQGSTNLSSLVNHSHTMVVFYLATSIGICLFFRGGESVVHFVLKCTSYLLYPGLTRAIV